MNSFHILHERKLLALAFDHLGSEVVRLENAVVRCHHRHYNQLLSLNWHVSVGINDPLHGQIRGGSAVELASAHSF